MKMRYLVVAAILVIIVTIVAIGTYPGRNDNEETPGRPSPHALDQSQ